MASKTWGAFGVGSLVSMLACAEQPTTEQPPAKPKPRPSATHSGEKPAPPQPSGKPSDPRAETVWLVIKKDGITLGNLGIAPGQRGELVLEETNEHAQELQTMWDGLAGKDLHLKMHVPPPPGEKGRGGLGSRTVKVGDPLYPHAVKESLRGYDVEELPALKETASPKTIGALEISKNGVKLGTLSFKGASPVMTGVGKGVDAEILESRWKDWAADGKKITLRYHHPDAQGVHHMVKVDASPGDADYPNAVRLALTFWYGYEIVVSA